MRNIDYIRKMKPKELAVFLNNNEYGCESCVYNRRCDGDCTRHHCLTGIKRWLKQEWKQ